MTAPVQRRVEDFEYPSEEIQQCPYPFFAALREQCPVYRVPGRDVVQLSRHDDLRSAIQHWEAASSDRSWLVQEISPEATEILKDAWPQRDLLLGEDPPSQTKHRKLVGYAFTPKRIQPLHDRVTEMADALIDAFVGRGEVDWIAEYADLLPARVITALLGVPFSDHDRIAVFAENYLDWTAKGINPLTLEREIECAHSIVEFQRYVHDQLETLREAPGENLLSDLAVSDEIDEGIKIDVARSMLVAGVETTRGLLGSSVLLLLQHPEQLALIRRDPTLIAPAVEEALRFESPAQRASRWLKDELEVDGETVSPGRYMQLLLGSANRDERVFERPDEFDITRPDVDRHLAFGQGLHFCIGSPLARLEGQVTLERLLARLPNVRLAPGQPIRYRDNPLTRCLAHLQLEWDV